MDRRRPKQPAGNCFRGRFALAKQVVGPCRLVLHCWPFRQAIPSPTCACAHQNVTSFESLSEASGFSDLFEFLSIALPDANPFCHFWTSKLRRSSAPLRRSSKQAARGRRVGERPPRGFWLMGISEVNNSNAHSLSVSESPAWRRYMSDVRRKVVYDGKIKTCDVRAVSVRANTTERIRQKCRL